MDTDDWWYTNSKKVDVTLASASNLSSPLSIHVPIHPMMGTNNDVLCSSIRHRTVGSHTDEGWEWEVGARTIAASIFSVRESSMEVPTKIYFYCSQ